MPLRGHTKQPPRLLTQPTTAPLDRSRTLQAWPLAQEGTPKTMLQTPLMAPSEMQLDTSPTTPEQP